MEKVKQLVQSRIGMGITGIALLFIMYALALRAIDTGSLQQYFLTFLCLGVGLHRIMRSIRWHE